MNSLIVEKQNKTKILQKKTSETGITVSQGSSDSSAAVARALGSF
jgi:hypothetical protein